jgi:ABC-2 type transport system permease protein
MMSNQSLATTRAYRLTFWRVVRSEWIKTYSLRSMWWLVAVAVVANVGLSLAVGLAVSLGAVSLDGTPERPLLVEIIVQAAGIIGRLAFLIMAILIITTEYSSGLVRSTFAAAPRRGSVLCAKLVVVLVTGVALFAVSAGASWALAYALWGGGDLLDTTLTSPTSLRLLGGFTLVMVLLAWFCFGLGAIIRSSAAAILTALGVIFLLPTLWSLLSAVVGGDGPAAGWRQWVVNAVWFLPSEAGGSITQRVLDPAAILGPWQGVGVLGAWTLVALAWGFIVTLRRDA